MKNVIAFVIGFSGLLLMFGVAGSDCDGACMENAMSLGDTILYGLLGLAMFAFGLFLGGAFNEEEY
jgi:hypothetical protein